MDKWLSNVNVVRVIALLLAVLLWAVVHMDISRTVPQTPVTVTTSSDTTQAVTIQKSGLDESRYHLISIYPASVTLNTKGKQAALKQINTTNVRVYVDLSNVIEGAQIVPVKVERLKNFPSGVESVTVNPTSVTVKIEKILKKEMPVTINLVGTPAEGLQAGTPIIKPNRVHIAMPESRLDLIQSVRASVNIDGAKEPVMKQVKLTAYDENGKEIITSISPAVVDVEVPITSPFKTMPLQIQLVGELPEGYSIAFMSQSANQVTVYAPQDVLDRTDFYNGLQIDLSSITSNKTFTLEIPLKPQVNRIEPGTVDVTLQIVPSETRKFDNMDITLSGENNQYETKVVKPPSGKIGITLEGAPGVLDKVHSVDIQAIVDVSNLPVGSYDLPVILNLPPFVRKAPGQDIKVGVEISDKSKAAAVQTDQGTGAQPSPSPSPAPQP